LATFVGDGVLAARAADNSDTVIFPRPKSYQTLKYAHTVRQERDFTCGSAALATILKFHYDMPVTEDMIVDMILKRYTPEEFKQKAKVGLSFEDLIFAAETLGFKAQAATIPISEVAKLNGPIIVQLEIRENDHFTVLRKKVGDVAYLSDPIQGAMTLDPDEFKKKFKGPVLAVWPAYIGDNFFSGLSIIRDPISVEQSLNSLITTRPMFPHAP